MDAQREDHGSRLRAVIGNLVACTNLHRTPLRPARAELCQMSAKNKAAEKFRSPMRQPILGPRQSSAAGVIVPCCRELKYAFSAPRTARITTIGPFSTKRAPMSEMADSLLAADEPAPVTVHNENGASP